MTPEQPAVGSTEPKTDLPAGPKVLVLGATGFLGGALVKRLLKDGISLRALVREPLGRAQWLAQLGVEVVVGDLADTASVDAALPGIQHVVHLARGSGPNWEHYLKSDVEPTRRLAELCCARDIQLIYTSSIAIYDGGHAADVITESTAPSAAALRLNIYARAKAANECLLADLHRRQALNVVVFRPGIVIGCGGEPRHPAVGAWLNASTCRPWGGGGHRLPFVLVDDCADALARALHVPGIAGESFNLIGEAELSGNGYLDELERCTGRKIRRQPRSAWRLFAQSLAKWALKRLTQQPEHPLPSYRYCDGLSCRATYKADRARQRLRWNPTSDTEATIDQGIAAAVVESSYMGPPR